jgi:hypothetical protein
MTSMPRAAFTPAAHLGLQDPACGHARQQHVINEVPGPGCS